MVALREIAAGEVNARTLEELDKRERELREQEAIAEAEAAILER